MSKSRYADAYSCVQCGEQIWDEDAVMWVNEEPAERLYPGYSGDPMCQGCYDKGPGLIAATAPDTVEEHDE